MAGATTNKLMPPPPAAAAGRLRELEEAIDMSLMECCVSGATVMLVEFLLQALADHAGAGQPVQLVLELSFWLCVLFSVWACYVTLLLARGRPRSLRTLLCALAWIAAAAAVFLLADDVAVSAVTGMLIMYAMALGAAGFLAWCLGEYYVVRTRNSTETTSASREQHKPATTSDHLQDALLQKKSTTARVMLVQEDKALDLEASLLSF